MGRARSDGWFARAVRRRAAVRECAPVRAAVAGARQSDQLVQNFAADTGPVQLTLEELPALGLVRPDKAEDRRGAPQDCWVERLVAVGAHHGQHREALSLEAVNAADEGIDPGTILVVHLGEVPGLRQRVCLVDEQHHAGPDVALRVPAALRGVGHLLERNEAFAPQVIASVRRLGLDPELVNAEGGAIALGHPLSATGIRLVLTLLRRLERTGGRRGLATLCIGVGQGLAVLVERA